MSEPEDRCGVQLREAAPGVMLTDVLGLDDRAPQRRDDVRRHQLDGVDVEELRARGWTRGDYLAEANRARIEDDQRWDEHMAPLGIRRRE